MELRTVLNRVHRLAGLVYGACRLRRDKRGDSYLEIDVRPRANGRPVCSGCGRRGPGYDHLATPSYQFVPLLGLPAFLVYAKRRVDCPRCVKVIVEQVPWADRKQRPTKAFHWFLASWAKRLSWKDTARVFRTSWDTVHRAVGMAVA